MKVIKTNAKGRMVREMMLGNQGRFVTVTFIKADGTERTINGNFGHVKTQNGDNTVAHIEKYVTIILPTKNAKGEPDRRNVNCETVKSLKINGETITFQ